MQQKRSIKLFSSEGDAQPWDSYVTETTSSNDDPEKSQSKSPNR